MAFCYSCGQKLEEDSQFCSNCGAKQESEVDLVVEHMASIESAESEQSEALNTVDGVELEKSEVVASIEDQHEEVSSPQVIEEDRQQVVEDEAFKASGIKEKKKRSQRIVKWLIIIALLLVVFFIGKFILGLLSGILNIGGSRVLLDDPLILTKKGDTYALIKEKMIEISNDEIYYRLARETDDYIYLVGEYDTLYVYLKRKNTLLEVYNVDDYLFSKDMKNIAVLSDGELYYGKVSDLEDLQEIADDVISFSAFNDLKTIFIVDEDNTLKEIDNKGNEQEFEEDDVYDVTSGCDRYLSYIQEDELIVYDYKKQDKIYDDYVISSEKHVHYLRTTDKDGSFLLYAGGKMYYISASEKDGEELHKSYMRFEALGKNFDNTLSSYEVRVSKNPTAFISEGRFLLNREKAEIEEYDLAIYFGSRILVKDEDEILVIDTASQKEINDFDLNLDDDEQFLTANYYKDDEIVVLTNQRALHYKGDKEQELDVDMEEIIEKNGNYIMTANDDATNSLYLFEEDGLYLIDRGEIKILYDDNDILNYGSVLNKNKNAGFVFYTDKDELFYVKGSKVKKIADDVENFICQNNGVTYLVDDVTYYYIDGKSIELGEDFLEE